MLFITPVVWKDLNLPEFNFHGLEGEPKRYSLHVNGPYCITFEWIEADAWRVDLENYHRTLPRYTTMTAEYLAEPRLQRPPVHPGELLRDEVLPAMGISVSEFARHIRVSRQLLHRILNETHGITPEMALRIVKFVGNGPDLWIRMQQAHDLWLVEQTLREELATIGQFHAV